MSLTPDWQVLLSFNQWQAAIFVSTIYTKYLAYLGEGESAFSQDLAPVNAETNSGRATPACSPTFIQLSFTNSISTTSIVLIDMRRASTPSYDSSALVYSILSVR